MSSFKLATRYAKSLIDISVEKNKLEEVTNDIRYFVAVCNSSKDFVALLRNPVIPGDKKGKITDAIFGASFNEITKGFIKLIINKSREAYLPEIAAAFIEQYNKIKHVTRVTLSTAIAADAEMQEKVKSLLREKAGLSDIELDTKVDTDLIGGFKLQYEDKLYDATVKRMLLTLDDNFLDNKYIKKF